MIVKLCPSSGTQSPLSVQGPISSDAFTDLAKLLTPCLERFARARLHDENDVDEALQGTLIGIFAVLQRGELIVSPLGFALCILRRQIANILAAKSRREAQGGELVDDRISHESKVDAEDFYGPAMAVVEKMREHVRIAVTLVWIEGKSSSEAAMLCGCHRGTICKLLQEAAQILRDWGGEHKCSTPAQHSGLMI